MKSNFNLITHAMWRGFTFGLVCFFCCIAFAQQSQLTPFIRSQESVIKSPFTFETSHGEGDLTKLRLEPQGYQEIKQLNRFKLLNFVLEDGKTVDLELERFSIFDTETKFVIGTPNGDIPLPVPDVECFTGKVSGDTSSQVFIAMSPFGSTGMIQVNNEIYYIAPNRNRSNPLNISDSFVYNQNAIPSFTTQRKLCNVVDGLYLDPQTELPDIESLGLEDVMYLVDIALDGTFSYYELMGSDSQVALTYMVQMVAGANFIYGRDLNTKLWISYCRIWTTQDPYEENDDDELKNFGDYWNANMSFVERDAALKITDTYSGGAAILGSLTAETFAYGVCGVNNSGIPNPVISGDSWWDLLVFVHELGHIFGSEHTHCYEPPIDECYADPEGCRAGESVTCQRGTIMSYCHNCPGSSGNVDPQFHLRVISKILEKLELKRLEGKLGTARNPSYVSLYNPGDEDGSQSQPWRKVGSGLRGCLIGGEVIIFPGVYLENLTIKQAVEIKRWGNSGFVKIGN